jgi:hypothetical protein
LSGYLEGRDPASLAARVGALIAQQQATWPMLAEGYEALRQVETRRVRVGESEVVIQHNPKRIRSTAAAVDAPSVRARRCFLCAENLPAEEKGIEYGDDLVILCNPFPVLDRHLSIVHRRHVPQEIKGRLERLLLIARDLGPEYFALYNGPECGASAPDHLHFQACSRELLPIEENMFEGEPVRADDCAYCEESAQGSFELFTLEGCGRSVVVIRGGDSREVAQWSYEIIARLARAAQKDEPMVNIVCDYVNREWRVNLFPRARHRPSCFFAEGPARLVISPGAIDMAGVVVVPEHEHFERVGAKEIAEIFSEVSLGTDALDELVEQVCAETVVEEPG